jgi:hypothetical protein
MSREWELRLGQVTVMPRKNHPGDVVPELIDKAKLQEAIGIASAMAGAAFMELFRFKNGQLAGDAALELHYALAKYFSIHPSHGGFEHYVDGITRVYAAIRNGLAAPYEIVVFDPTDKNAFAKGALGYVRPTRSTVRGGVQTAPLSPIRQRLRIPAEWQHADWNENWKGFEDVGRIHLSLGLLFSGDPPADAVARTIVHEASHKFARTTDVLYKHQAFGRSAEAPDGEGVAQATMVVGDKRITPMAGAENGAMISPHRYIENADSYAWAARRLWKRRGR